MRRQLRTGDIYRITPDKGKARSGSGAKGVAYIIYSESRNNFRFVHGKGIPVGIANEEIQEHGDFIANLEDIFKKIGGLG